MEREPSFFEQYQLTRNVHRYYTNFNITGKYSKPILKELLSNALALLLSRNTILTTNFFRKDPQNDDPKSFVARSVTKIAFLDVVSYKQIAKFDELVLFDLDKILCPADQELPMWRIIIHETHTDKGPIQYLTVVFDHTLYDGESGAIFHKDLVAALDQVSQSSPEDLEFKELVFEAESPKVYAPTKEILNVYESNYWFKLPIIAKELLVPNWLSTLASYLYSFWDPKTAYQPYYQYKVLEKATPITHYQLINIAPDKLKQTIAKCKAEGVTINSHLIISTLAALQGTIMKKIHTGDSKSFSTSTIVAINGRRFVKSSSEVGYGLVVGAATFNFPMLPEKTGDLFPYMKRLHESILAELETGNPTKLAGLLQHVDIGEYFNKKFGKHSKSTFDVSNLGLRKYTSGDWELEDMVFSQLNGFSCHFDISVVTTPKGGLNIVFGYFDEIKQYQQELAEFREQYESRLLFEYTEQ